MSGYIDPTRAQFDAFKALDRDRPVEMLNLVRFKPQATYPDDHPLAGTSLSGAEAYANYGRETAHILAEVGGRILWRADYETTLIGPDAERWDAMFIAHYPTAHAFLAMISNPEYQKAVVHRQAAVETSRLVRTRPAPATDRFA